MTNVNEQPVVRNAHQPLVASNRGLDKGGIFGDIGGREAQAFGEEPFPKNKRAAMHITDEHPPVQIRVRSPKPPGRQLEEERVFQAREIGFTVVSMLCGAAQTLEQLVHWDTY